MDKSTIKALLPYLKVQDEKVFKLDLIDSLKEAELNNPSVQENRNIEIHIKLNDVQVYWINKLNMVIKENNLSVKSLFSSENIEIKDKINLYEFIKIIRKRLSLNRLSNQEIENIVKCLDINKNGEITLNELEDIIELSNSEKTIRKSLRDSLSKREVKNKPNHSKENKIDMRNLPVKGNHEVIKELRKSIMKEQITVVNNCTGKLEEVKAPPNQEQIENKDKLKIIKN